MEPVTLGKEGYIFLPFFILHQQIHMAIRRSYVVIFEK